MTDCSLVSVAADRIVGLGSSLIVRGGSEVPKSPGDHKSGWLDYARIAYCQYKTFTFGLRTPYLHLGYEARRSVGLRLDSYQLGYLNVRRYIVHIVI